MVVKYGEFIVYKKHGLRALMVCYGCMVIYDPK